ncbi:Flavin monooxygenase FMO [Penicillium chermesinum]|uniref:Flavin monooxygenase FMO n=1 Tax=Penicillium chermesinum TaxID=63820 RepID=A0A9W9NH93_9EURO|nr:Flavin monooxygenase FMO [Penicillium chermesinum]KAJ5219974.1 Flavin monooxygenase FMO [Penicillium chermesinum]
MNVQRIAVIGAGPCGLGIAKYLIAEKYFQTITLFEQRDQPGGVWNYTGDLGLETGSPTAHASPSSTPQERVNGQFVSPVYDSLETNIPKTLMNFNDLAFPEETPLFPPHDVVQKYLHRYAEDLTPYIRYQSLVVNVSRSPKEWTVQWRDLKNEQIHAAPFDAVIVANGHHNDPKIPAIPGLAEWNRAYPDSILHSSSYRRPESFANKKVIIVGHSASGIDIGFQISSVSQHPLLISEPLPEIRRFDPQNARVEFINGHEEFGVDHVVFCTGYHFSIPFLSSLQPPRNHRRNPSSPSLSAHILHSGSHASVHRVSAADCPVPVEPGARGVGCARVFGASGSSIAGRDGKVDSRVDGGPGDGQGFNTLPFPLDADYISYLYGLCQDAGKRDGLENGGNGKAPPYWGEKERWTRERFPLIKKASQALGSRRGEITSLEQLGFNFEEEKKKGEGGESHL